MNSIITRTSSLAQDIVLNVMVVGDHADASSARADQADRARTSSEVNPKSGGVATSSMPSIM